MQNPADFKLEAANGGAPGQDLRGPGTHGLSGAGRTAPQRKNRYTFIRVLIALTMLALGLVLTELLSRDEPHPAAETMRAAAQRMARAEAVVAGKRQSLGIAADLALDPYRTGLIGVESSMLTTTVGDIVAKRTTTNTAFAALVVRYFYELGLKPATGSRCPQALSPDSARRRRLPERVSQSSSLPSARRICETSKV